MSIKETISEITDELLAIIIVAPTMIVLSYQAITASEITMPTMLAGIIVGYYFGTKKQTSET